MPSRADAVATPVPSGRPGYAKSLDTRARILAAALEEASDAGIHHTSLAAIALRAGVAIGTLNYHFGSREELLRELMATLTTDLLSRLDDTDPRDAGDFFARERAGLLAYLEHLRANPAYLRLANEVRFHEPELHRRAVAGWLDRIAARIRAGIARGDLRPMDDAEIAAQAHFMLGASQFLDFRIRRGGEPHPSDGAVVDAYVALLRRGLGASAGTRRPVPVAGRRPKRRAGRRRSASRATGVRSR